MFARGTRAPASARSGAVTEPHGGPPSGGLALVWRSVRLAQRVIQLEAHVCSPASLPALALDLHVDLGPVHGNVRGRLNTQKHLLALNREHRDLNVVADHDALSELTR